MFLLLHHFGALFSSFSGHIGSTLSTLDTIVFGFGGH